MAEPLRRLLRNRDLSIILGGRALSYAGDGLAVFALTLRVHDAGHGAGAIAALMACFALPIVLGMGLGGSIADRFDSRRVLLVTSTTQAAVVSGLALVDGLAATLALVVALQLAHVVASPTWTALLPRVAGEDQLHRAASTQQALIAVAGIGGTALGGVVVGAASVEAALWADAATFLALAVAALAVRTRRQPQRQDGTGWSLRSVVAPEGLAVLRRDALLWPLLMFLVPFTLMFEAVNVAEVFLVKDELAASTTVFGVIQACSAAGAVLGAAWTGRVTSERARVAVLAGGQLAAAVAVALAGIAPNAVAVAACFTAVGAAHMACNAALWPTVLLRTPEADRGRASAAAMGLLHGSSLASLALGALAGVLLGPRETFVLGGVAAALVATLMAVRLRSWWTRAAHSGPEQEAAGALPPPAPVAAELDPVTAD